MIALDDRLETAMFAYPFRAGWVDSDGVTLVRNLTPNQAADANVALIDSMSALTMLRSHVIVRDAAVASRTASMLTLTTHIRPDDVDNVTVVIAGVSPAGRAVASAVLAPFYGITATEWSEENQAVDEATAVIAEGAMTLIPVENEEHYQEDLGRAWYLLTDRPFLSHVCVAPRALLAGDPATVRQAVERLLAAKATGQERGRELRRDLSKDHGVDRETLTDVLADQAFTLGDEEIDGLAELARRAGLGVSKKEFQAATVTVS